MTDSIVRRFPNRPRTEEESEPLVEREWLVTNGLGGYASSTVAGVNTRKYHGLLVSALPNPLGRTVMLNHLVECIVLPDGESVQLSGEERVRGQLVVPAREHLTEFRLEAGMPVWTYRLRGFTLERRIVMPHRQNTTYVIFTLMEGPSKVRMELRPAVHFRNYEASVAAALQSAYVLAFAGDSYELACGDPALPSLRIVLLGSATSFVADERELPEVHYRLEEDRGYEFAGRLWSPGSFTIELSPGGSGAVVASTEALEAITALTATDAIVAERLRREHLLSVAPPSLREGLAAELVLAADQFVVVPIGRTRDAVRALAEGGEIRSVIAGYHWFTDWGRDTMIALEGLTLATGRHREAANILRTFSQYVREGLIPNMFPDGSNEGLYHTADATLWFFHALDRYVNTTGDRAMLARLLPTMIGIAEHHLKGTRFGIHVDAADGLVLQGADGYQLTWMDAKVDGWVVTPRRGKAVEINALWYNALVLLERWVCDLHGDESARQWGEHASRARTAFNRRFWYADGQYLFDVVDGPDGDVPELRPNQIFAVSLPHPVLDREHWPAVLDAVERRLLTPYGLRSLAPGSPNYRARYFGNLHERDAAYHQGTVWAWLIGPWVDAWLALHPDNPRAARRFLYPLAEHLNDFGLGSVAEVFDAEAPYAPRGCAAQAWSLAELLRCWARTE